MKKPAPDAENIPPVPCTVTKGTKTSAVKSNLTVPPSPSKRRQPSCHYSDVESSPPKKRDLLSNLAEDERGLLLQDRQSLGNGERKIEGEKAVASESGRRSVVRPKIVRTQSRVSVLIA
jgi:hypothetical protein